MRVWWCSRWAALARVTVLLAQADLARIDAKLLKMLPQARRLVLLGPPGTPAPGVEWDALAQRGIVVSHTPPARMDDAADLALAVLLALLVWVVPVFEEVFQAFGAALPWSTQWVLGLSRALTHPSWALLLACALLAALAITAGRQARWRLAWQRQLLDWPVLGTLTMLSVSARWAHTLSALLAAGVPLAEALPSASQSAQHPVYARIGTHLQRRVAQGGRLSEALAHTGRFPPLLVQLCATGEDSGMLEAMLARAAELLGEELETRIASASRLIEPLVVVLMGAVIGVILVAMYLPIFQLGQVF